MALPLPSIAYGFIIENDQVVCESVAGLSSSKEKAH